MWHRARKLSSSSILCSLDVIFLVDNYDTDFWSFNHLLAMLHYFHTGSHSCHQWCREPPLHFSSRKVCLEARFARDATEHKRNTQHTHFRCNQMDIFANSRLLNLNGGNVMFIFFLLVFIYLFCFKWCSVWNGQRRSMSLPMEIGTPDRAQGPLITDEIQ